MSSYLEKRRKSRRYDLCVGLQLEIDILEREKEK